LTTEAPTTGAGASSLFTRLRLFTFLGALLLFGLEPLVGRLLLPASGGGFHVWTTCLMVFQGTLLLGYAYCHLLAPRLGRWHLLLVLLPALVLPIAVQPGNSPLPPLLAATGALQPPDPHAPILSIIRALLVGVCLPFAVLSTTGVVAQAWLSRSDLPERREPYQLYAASNLGSLAALLAYPLVIEPFLRLETQRLAWSAGFCVYAALAFLVAPRAGAPAPPPEESLPEPKPAADPMKVDGEDDPDAERPARVTPGVVLYWTLLAAAPSIFLLAVTNVIALDIGSVPLVWVLPLGIYLLSFVLAFGRRPWYPPVLRRFWPETALVGLFYFAKPHHGKFGALDLVIQAGALFVICIVAHGELYRARPAPRHLTGFYLSVSVGGFLGGLLPTLVAPFWFTSLAEYPIALALLAATLIVGRRHALRPWLKTEPRLFLAGTAIICTIIGYRWIDAVLSKAPPNILELRRNAYGIYKVVERNANSFELEAAQLGQPQVAVRHIYHGTTLHGTQVRHPQWERRPISYYHTQGPLGDVLDRLDVVPKPRRGAVVGMGAGTTAAYFDKGDAFVFYELDPGVLDMATRHFTYYGQCEAEKRVVLGDARLRLADDPLLEDGRLDVLVVDAFSSDAIPVHLLTREALELFARRIGPKGVVCLHISNRYYDLLPPIAATARTLGLKLASKSRATSDTKKAPFEDASDWVALVKDEAVLGPLLARGWSRAGDDMGAGLAPWTDDYANLLASLYWFDRRPPEAPRSSKDEPAPVDTSTPAGPPAPGK
jgi:hypothetical protein